MEQIISICKNAHFDNTGCTPVFCANGKNWGLLVKVSYQACEIAKMLNNYSLAICCIKIFGLILLMVDNIKRSIKCFELVRSISEDIQDPQQINEAFRMLGQALQVNKEYSKAILCYKKILLYSWVYGLK